MVRLANIFIDQCIEAERCLLSLGWLQPSNLDSIGCQLHLNGNHFTTNEHKFIYAYICSTAQASRKLDVLECMSLGKKNGVDLGDDFLFDLILRTDICDGMLQSYAETVFDYARKRERAQKCFQEYRHITSGGITSPQKHYRNYNRKRQVVYV